MNTFEIVITLGLIFAPNAPESFLSKANRNLYIQDKASAFDSSIFP